MLKTSHFYPCAIYTDLLKRKPMLDSPWLAIRQSWVRPMYLLLGSTTVNTCTLKFWVCISSWSCKCLSSISTLTKCLHSFCIGLIVSFNRHVKKCHDSCIFDMQPNWFKLCWPYVDRIHGFHVSQPWKSPPSKHTTVGPTSGLGRKSRGDVGLSQGRN